MILKNAVELYQSLIDSNENDEQALGIRLPDFDRDDYLFINAAGSFTRALSVDDDCCAESYEFTPSDMTTDKWQVIKLKTIIIE